MTFSRPQTSPVGAFTTPARPNEPQAAPRQIVSASENGRLRVVDLGGGADNYGEVKALFDRILEGAPKIVDEVTTRRANVELARFVENVDTVEAVKRGDEAAVGMVMQLSPKAQESLYTGLAGIAANDFAKSFARSSATDGVLLTPRGKDETDEQYNGRMAERRATIRQQALAESGVMNLPAEYQGRFAIDMQRAESLVMNDVRDTQSREYRKDYAAKQASVYGRSLVAGVERIQALSARKADGTNYTQEEQEREMAKINNIDLDFYNQNIQNFTPSEIGAMMFDGFRQQFQRLVASKYYTFADALITFQQILMQRPIATPAGGTLYGIQVGESGMDFRTAVASLRAELAPLIEQEQAKQNYLEIQPLIPGLLANDPSAVAKLDQMLPTLARTPEQLNQLITIRERLTSIGQEPTEAQKQRQLEFTLAASKGDVDIAEYNQRVANDPTLTTDQKLRLIQKEDAKVDDVTENVARARSYNEPQIRVATENLARALIAKSGGTLSPEDAVRRAGTNLLKVATENTEIQVQRLKDAGKPVTPDAVNAIFRNELDAVTAGEFKRLKEAPPSRPTVQQERMRELNEIQQNLRRTRGRITTSTFPQTVIDAARQNGVPTNDVRSLTKFFLRRLGSTLETDGKTKAFPDPGKTWREILNRSTNTRGGSNQYRSQASPVDRVASLVQQFLGGSNSSPPKGGSTAPRQSQPDVMRVAQSLGGRLLTGVMNVFVPPAMAAQGEFPIANTENMPRLAARFRESNRPNTRPMSLREGPLPQVVATAPMQPVPLAITNDRHPFFIAIGINEGTRTADGGYTRNYWGHTDPGDGNRNVGTVSGGGARGGGGSPQTVDRVWAGRLTQQAMRAAPLLVQAGIPRNTVGFHRVMFNYLDLSVQAPAAAADFLRKLPQMQRAGLTIESIAKARTDSFYYPNGRWGAVWPYPRMLQDQRSRAGTFDYRRRI